MLAGKATRSDMTSSAMELQSARTPRLHDLQYWGFGARLSAKNPEIPRHENALESARAFSRMPSRHRCGREWGWVR